MITKSERRAEPSGNVGKRNREHPTSRPSRQNLSGALAVVDNPPALIGFAANLTE